MTSLIMLARITDTHALERLRQQSRLGSHAQVLGLAKLADTLLIDATGRG